MAKKSLALTENENSFIEELKKIIQQSRKKAYVAINYSQVEANWFIGRRIVEQEQNGKSIDNYFQTVNTRLRKYLNDQINWGHEGAKYNKYSRNILWKESRYPGLRGNGYKLA